MQENNDGILHLGFTATSGCQNIRSNYLLERIMDWKHAWKRLRSLPLTAKFGLAFGLVLIIVIMIGSCAQ